MSTAKEGFITPEDLQRKLQYMISTGFVRFNKTELRALLKLVEERILWESGDPSPNIVTVRGFSINTAKKMVTKNDVPVHVTPQGFTILLKLALNAGKVVSQFELGQSINPQWSEKTCKEAIKVLVRDLRRSIEDDPKKPTYFKTVRGFGYMLDNKESD